MANDEAHGRAFEATRLAVQLAGSIIGARGGNTDVREAVDLVKEVRQALLPMMAEGAVRGVEPAVPISDSVHDDHIICLEDGRKLKLLKRYLESRYKMTPDEYRRKWGLPPDYPMAAKSYSRERSEMARRNGLGRKKV